MIWTFLIILWVLFLTMFLVGVLSVRQGTQVLGVRFLPEYRYAPEIKAVVHRFAIGMAAVLVVLAAVSCVLLLPAVRAYGEILMFDVSNRAQVVKAMETWEKEHPDEYVEVLVNNAGIRRDNVLVFMSEEEWNGVLNVTLSGFYNVTQALLQPMLVHKYGRIINLASVSGLKGQPGQTNYAAAKGGIIAATKALALEVARKNVTVNAVAPGFIETDMTEGLDVESLKATIPVRRFGKPEEVAELIGFLASPEAGYITGEVVSINGGLHT